MSSPILKIDSIKNIAVYKNFQWSNSVRDEGNNITDFKNINVIYGRNYSGKTTLSRIIRSAEIGVLSDKYVTPEFKFSFADGSNVTQNTLTTHSNVIRVFNEDFVRDNLRFITDDEQTINSFAILGEDNARLEEEIETNEIELGSDEDKSGLIGKYLEANEKNSRAANAYNRRLSALESKLRDKANKAGSGIKHNKVFGNANYNLTKIKSDIQKVINDSYSSITDENVLINLSLLKEIPKAEVRESSPFNLNYSLIFLQAKELIEKKIQASAPIQELLNDSVLAAWVRSGREKHEDKREQCAFCGNDLPPELWDKLDKHFNQESESLRSALNGLLASIQKEKDRLPSLLKINNSEFYSNFHEDLDTLKEELSRCIASYLETIEMIEVQVKSRMEDIFKDIIFEEPATVETELNNIRLSFEEYRHNANQSTTSLSSDQFKARDALRLHEVFTFINDITYVDECNTIEKLKEDQSIATRLKIATNADVRAKRKKISELKAQLKDDNYTTFYNFGNNARKFFEIYLYYKYPDQGMTQTTLKSFFGEESVPAILSDRINNEYSHLAGVFERGSTPVEVPEMHTAAKFILDKIKQNDNEQYVSLVQSVGEVSA